MGVESFSMTEPRIAYFSMEIALANDLPTYAGGLGVLAGDTLRSAADLGIPLAAVTLVHRKGYFAQSLDEAGQQHEAPVAWKPEERFTALAPRVEVAVEGRRVAVRG